MNASKAFFWSARWLGLGVKISCAHVHCFAPVTVTMWRWEMQSECRKTEVLVKIELLSSPRAVLCVCFAQHSKKKIRRARPAYKHMIPNYSQWTRSTPNASLLWLASWARYCQLDRSMSLWQTYEVCVWMSAPNTSNNNGYTFVSIKKNHGHIFRPEIKLAWPEQNMTCFVGELTFHNHLLLGQFKLNLNRWGAQNPSMCADSCSRECSDCFCVFQTFPWEF